VAQDDMRPRQNRRPSMRDVAARAGVSVGTVSYALNRPSRVGAETLVRVRAAIEELEFVPNSAARSMKSGGGTGLGIVVGDIRHSFSVEVARGAQLAATEAGTTLLIANGNDDLSEQSRYVDLFDQARMEGVIIESTYNSKGDIDKLHEHHRRVVLVNHRSIFTDTCMVLMDNEGSGYTAAKHLMELGARRLAFVTRVPGLQPLEDRLLGIQRAVAEDQGATLVVVETQEIFESDGREAAAGIIELPQSDRPDGVIVGTALMAKGLVAELLEQAGIRVPEDLRLVCTEVNLQAAGGHVPFTTVAEPAFEMGFEAVTLAMRELSDDEETHVHRTITLNGVLQVAESTVGATESDALSTPR
jgi:LacI family transcriptional regulator